MLLKKMNPIVSYSSLRNIPACTTTYSFIFKLYFYAYLKLTQSNLYSTPLNNADQGCGQWTRTWLGARTEA